MQASKVPSSNNSEMKKKVKNPDGQQDKLTEKDGLPTPSVATEEN